VTLAPFVGSGAREARGRALAVILLLGAALLGACDRSPSNPSPAPAPAVNSAAALKAGDAACRLPLGRFAPSLRRLVGSILSPPTNLVIIDPGGRIRGNSHLVDPQRRREYLAIAAPAETLTYLRIYPDREAPCDVVRDTLVAAVRVGRCTPRRCAFEWPPGDPPPPPD